MEGADEERPDGGIHVFKITDATRLMPDPTVPHLPLPVSVHLEVRHLSSNVQPSGRPLVLKVDPKIAG